MGAHGSDSFVTIPLLFDEEPLPLPNASKADPHGAVPSPTSSFFKTCFHGINAISGIGIVSIPYAVASGGWLSLSLLFLIAIACYYTGIMVQRCMDMDPDIRTFPDIGQRAFGHKGRLMVSIAMNSELYLVVAGYLILEGDNINKLIPNLEIDIGGFTIGGPTLSAIVAALIILPTVWLQDLSLLSYVSATGALASTVFLLSLWWNAALDGTGFHGKGTVWRWGGIPNAVGLYAFCYSAHPVLPTLYTSMRNRSHFSTVLLVCFSLCTVGYAAAAVLGYLMFGQDVQSQITLDLPAGKLSSRVAIYTTLVNPIAKYALMLTPTINAAKGMVPSHYNKRLTHLVVSTSMLISNLIVAVSIPLYGYLMALAGALLCVSTSILVPSVCYLKISGAYRRFGCDMIISYSIIVMGVAIAVVGTYTSLLDIIGHL
ncbi:amino acid transporter AVT1I-like [Neltuma alba]|uniref:amino acid transporter AVT1I-like n=1 Tax=Neltuma alba TaxID=207710 RepID=UPI0010A4B859|nr:amino acid transporter AVT1I-like [Prosopis alba]XP_028785671.1 amino acid transporter AVT1I-like [Prosopis alba]